jgi:hypothetical protein
MTELAVVEKTEEKPPIKLDIGCGKNKREGFIGVDQYAIPGVDVVMDVRTKWPYEDNSVDEVNCSHFLEHLTGVERVKFFNELWRVLKLDAKATVITPYWASNRAYGDFTHQWPPVSEMAYYYLSGEFRLTQTPHTDISVNPDGYDCNFVATWGYALHPEIVPKNVAYQQHAITFWKEAAQDMYCTLIKKARYEPAKPA